MYVEEIGIKSTQTLVKHIKEHLNVEVDAVKVANSIRIFWAVDNTLHKYDIKASVIYVIKIEQLEEAMAEIKKTLPWQRSQK